MIFSMLKQNFLANWWLLLAHGVFSIAALSPREPVSDWTALIFGLLATGYYYTAIAIFVRVVQSNTRFLAAKSTEGQSPLLAASFATLIVAVVIIVPPLIVQSIGLQRYAVPAAEVPGLLAESALLLSLVLTFAGALAALTKSGIGFVGAFIMLALCGQALKGIMGLMSGGEGAREADFVSLVTLLIPLTVMAFIILHQYRTHNTRRGIMLGSAAFLISQVSPAPSPPLRHRVESQHPLLADSLRPAQLRLMDERTRAWAQRGKHGWLTMSSSIHVEPRASRYKHVLRVREIRMRHAGGKVELLTPPTKAIAVFTPAIDLGSALHWIGPHSDPYPLYQIEYGVTRAQYKVLETTGADVEIDAQLELLEPKVVKLPLVEKAELHSPGERTTMDQVGNPLNQQGFSLTMISIGSAQKRTRIEPRWYSFALANERRGEAVPLRHSEHDEAALRLPMSLISRSSRSIHLFVEDSSRLVLFRIGKSWLDEAHIRVTDWVPIGAYSVTISGRQHLLTAARR